MGWGLKKVSVLLGHADVSITARIYAHLLDGDLKVRDDIRPHFDNHSRSEDETVAHALAETIAQSLQGTNEGERVLLALLR